LYNTIENHSQIEKTRRKTMSKKESAVPAEPATPAEPIEPATPATPSVPSEPEKPGYATSEFWITLVSTVVPNLITLLTIFKLVPTEIASTLSTALVAVIGGIITVVVALKYIKSRTEIKVRTLHLADAVKSRRIDMQATKMNMLIQLLDRSVVSKDAVKKEIENL
jgi:hypothetical protein